MFKLEKKSLFWIKIAMMIITLSSLGALILLCISPFWRFNCQMNPGYWATFLGSVVAIANAILLYATLNSQKESLANEKKAHKQERFETTLFNLLDKYFEQINRIKFEAIILQNPPNESNATINGSSFIAFAFEQLYYLKEYFAKECYLGYYDSSNDHIGYDYKSNPKEESEYDEYLHTKYMANIYGISKEKYDLYKEQIKKKQKTSIQICYYLF